MLTRVYKIILIANNLINMTASLKKSLLSSLYQREGIPSLLKPSFISPSLAKSPSIFPTVVKRGEGRFFKKGTLISVFLSIFILGIFSAPAYSTDWKITLKVSGGGIYDYCIAGVKDGATDGHDNAWDIPAPPGSFYKTYINAYFPHPDWYHVFERFRQDIRSPDLPKDWTFEVVSNIPGYLNIQWPDLKNAIPDKEAVLIDIEGSGMEIDMHTSSSFTFLNNKDVKRRFLVEISQSSISVPKPPEGLKGNLIKKKSVLMHWSKNQELDLVGYNVHRSTISGSDYEKLNYSPIPEHNYTDAQVEKNHKYYYVVTAVNTAGGESGYSNEVEVSVGKDKAGKDK